ncbi:NAD(P)/FAD-dependent oxidoreductase [Shimia biformata]|uniref:NAD(P)/FAD-dependent oxidoreductase n=1 Tax=Shimia biformata TaxID=1294299 RepID=UPI00194FB8F9|nr:FAD-dependent oxidoreductase [Shimia biformata]
MSFDASPITPRHIAIVGGGISGLAAAYLLAPVHRVTLVEAAPRLGGHARTVVAGRNGNQPVDTGFIVFNHINYPHLTAMFDALNVPTAKSEMSFGATIDGGRIEYGLQSLDALLANRSNLLKPQFLRMVADILKFIRRAETAATTPDMTIGDLMEGLKVGDWFRRYYLLPITGAIWSTSPEQILDFPAQTLVSFFRNHNLLQYGGQHQWHTVAGGSHEYVWRLERHLRSRGVHIRTATPVQAVERGPRGVTIRIKGEDPIQADDVIMACHSDDALRLLANPTPAERQALGMIRYQDNFAVLHCDPAQMPRKRAAWQSWVYKADHAKPNMGIGVTYWMNRLQNIDENDPLFVSLNPCDPVPDHLIYDATTFRHPVFDHDALRGQSMIGDIQGHNSTWFAGAYLRHGFHEDGFHSAVNVAEAIDRQTRVEVAA